MQNFEGKVAFVTGGASGIGLGMARNFLAEGMKVVIADWNEDHLAQAREILAGSNAVHFIKLDVSDREQMRAAAQEALDMFGKIHVLCNNAGVGGGGAADDPDFDEWDKAISINLGGVINGSKIIVPIIQQQGEGGHVVNTSSMAGIVPLPGLSAYSTSKYAVRGYTESLRLALAAEGIGVSCLYPGAVRTALVPVPDEGEEDVPEGPDGELLKQLFAAMRVAMDPMDMGAAVVEAIRENRPHILTHAEFLDEVKARNRAMEDAFPDTGDVPDARTQFENTRRGVVDELLAIPAKD
jgi:NAD(P)-dependent dehydrogenase (short-subunit alcohol dehydrogenase family)